MWTAGTQVLSHLSIIGDIALALAVEFPVVALQAFFHV